jgi:hypothetical protein
MEEICPEFPKDASRLKAWIEVGMECGDFTLILQSGENRLSVQMQFFEAPFSIPSSEQYNIESNKAPG